jgi:hypothetical protein
MIAIKILFEKKDIRRGSPQVPRLLVLLKRQRRARFCDYENNLWGHTLLILLGANGENFHKSDEAIIMTEVRVRVRSKPQRRKIGCSLQLKCLLYRADRQVHWTITAGIHQHVHREGFRTR